MDVLLFALIGCGDPESAGDPDGDGATRDVDCAEGDPDVYPGAPEYCRDGVVNDCDATEAEAREFCALWRDVSAEQASAVLRPGGAGERVGAAIVGLGGRVGVGAPGDEVVWVVGGDARSRVDLAEVGVALRGEAGASETGAALAAPGDLDRDGAFDLVIAAPGARRSDEARIYVEAGPFDAERTLGGGAVWAADGGTGGALAVGDVDGDGIADVIAGAPELDGGLVYAGDVGGGTFGETNEWLRGGAADDELGAAVAVADLDGDGIADLAAGSPGYDGNRGAVYVALGPFAAARGAAEADFALVGPDATSRAGTALASGGDVDGDGRADLVVGAPVAEGRGVAYLLRAPASGELDVVAAAALSATRAADYAGESVALVGDVDADGYDDVAVGAPEVGGASGGAYVVFGPVHGTLDLGDADIRVTTAYDAAELGRALAGVGDLDGDGRADFALGGANHSERGEEAGIAWVFLAAPI